MSKWIIKLHSQPLKDIAAVSGQSARFECIVQCDPHPNNVFWTKNGQVVENGPRYQIEFRNGVCRLFIPQSFPGAKNTILKCKHFLSKIFLDDAGTYECVAQNPIGADATRAVLMVPGDKRGFRIYWSLFSRELLFTVTKPKNVLFFNQTHMNVF